MCTFISLVVNADADLEKVGETFARHHVRFEDAPLAQGMPRNLRHFVHDGVQCDCGTHIGGGYVDCRDDDKALEILRKKGWGAAKITRWKTQRRDAESKNRRVDKDRERNAQKELVRWTGILRALMATPSVDTVGIMHDNYAHGPGHDKLNLAVQQTQSIRTLDEHRLWNLPGGTLLLFHRG